MLTPTDFFDLSDESVALFFENCSTVYEVLPRIQDHVKRLIGDEQQILGEVMEGAWISDRPIFIHPTARIEPGAYIHGPAYIGANAVVRHGAFVRENVILLDKAILGHASEAKNALFLPNAHAPHFNYVGDSILGQNVNLGAGTKLSNLTMVSEKDLATGKRPTVKISVAGERVDLGVAKIGAIIGDNVQTGCNSVLNPGCLIGEGCLVYANLSVRAGYYPPRTVIKLRQKTATAPRR